jgi:hypothetical protein
MGHSMFDSRTKARSLAFLFSASALAGVIAVVLPSDTPVTEAMVLALAGLSVLIASTLLRFGDQISDSLCHVTLASFTIVLSLLVHFTHQETLFALIYVWPALFAFYFFQWRAAIAHLAFIGASYAFVLSAEDDAAGITVRLVLVLAWRPACWHPAQRAPGAGAAQQRAAHPSDRRERARRLPLDRCRGSRAGAQRSRRATAGTFARGHDRPAVPAARRAIRCARQVRGTSPGVAGGGT